MTDATIKDLEERSKRIFSNLGLKDLDIKIWENINGKTDEKHIHVGRDGVKTDFKTSSSSSESKPQEQEKKGQSVFDMLNGISESCSRKKTALESLAKWFAGDIDTDKLLGTCKKLFEDRCAKEFGSTALDKLAEEIDKTAKTFLNDPSMSKIIKNLNEVGIRISQDDLNEAASKLKQAWGYSDTVKSEKREEKKPCACGGSCQCKKEENVNAGTDDRKPASKAEEIREMLKNARAEEEKKRKEAQMVRINALYNVIDSVISIRRFTALDNDAGIVIKITKNNIELVPTEHSQVVVPAVEKIVSEYGFNGYTIDTTPHGLTLTFLF
jgi:hypothetical protein